MIRLSAMKISFSFKFYDGGQDVVPYHVRRAP